MTKEELKEKIEDILCKCKNCIELKKRLIEELGDKNYAI